MRTPVLIWLLFAACLAVSFLLSGMEAGVFALSRLRVRQQMRAGRRSAKILHDFLENPENFLWTILVGNTVANFLILGWLIQILFQRLQHHRFWFVLVFAMAVFLFYTFFDLLPKMLFRTYPNRLCMMLAIRFAGFILCCGRWCGWSKLFPADCCAGAGEKCSLDTCLEIARSSVWSCKSRPRGSPRKSGR